jgi:predicted Rossmann-fold nucleotide-binding protein
MADRQIPKRIFPEAKEDAAAAKAATPLPQTADPAYRLAYADPDFLLRDDLRPVRFQLELLKPELLQEEAGIGSTFVFYGSARIPSPERADAIVEAAKTETQLRIAERLKAKSHYCEVARELARLASGAPTSADGKRQFVVCSGGGPSIMEAANRGAADVGQESIGLNIVLPFEQAPNPYVTPHLSFNFHYFALRKMHFLLRARAVAVFPGGFGTFDEFFELLTLIQTGKTAAPRGRSRLRPCGRNDRKRGLLIDRLVEAEMRADAARGQAAELRIFRIAASILSSPTVPVPCVST